MITLPRSLRSWGTDRFALTLKEEVRALPAGTLPLQNAVAQGGLVDESDLALTVFHSEDDARGIRTNVGVFFTEIVINCGCGADPMPQNAYCTMQITIDKVTADTAFHVLSD